MKDFKEIYGEEGLEYLKDAKPLLCIKPNHTIIPIIDGETHGIEPVLFKDKV